MGRRTAAVGSALVVGLLATACSTSDEVAGAPDDQGIPSAPSEPPPTGSKWEGVAVEGECGRVSLEWVLVDEVCGGTEDPAYLEAFRAPIFRDGAEIGSRLYAVDATHLWVLDVTDPTRPARQALVAGLGQPLAVAAFAGDLVVAAGGEGLLLLDLSDPEAPTRRARPH